jgi:hypothetical protein
MIAGALAVSTAVATERENTSINEALLRECCRYGIDYDRAIQSLRGSPSLIRKDTRAWWDYAIVAAAIGVFVYLGCNARVPALAMNYPWLAALVAVLIAAAIWGGWGLWKANRFS